MKALVVTNTNDSATTNRFYGVVDSAFGRNHQPWFLPDFGINWRWRLALGVKISRLGKSISPKFAQRYFDSMSLMWIAEADSVEPSELHCMDGAAVCGEWLPLANNIEISGNDIHFTIPYAECRFPELVSYVSQYMTLKTGDVVALALPMEAMHCQINQNISLTLNGAAALSFNIK